MNMIHILDLTSVGIFGMVLSTAFCDIHWTRKKGLIMVGSMAMILILQGAIYFFLDSDLVEYIYPVITHIPLTVILCIFSRKYLWSVISVLTAYLCCQVRSWTALLVVTLFSGGTVMKSAAALALTLPILLLILRFIAPSVRLVSQYPLKRQILFGLIPALYYGFDYLTSIYTSLLYEGNLAVLEFMPFVCSVAYLMFVVDISKETKIRIGLEHTQEILNLQMTQAVREIRSLRELQKKTSIYRHDLRHHMQYLLNCIENNRIEQAQAYIQEICSELEANKVTVYCENEVVNLIFSAFAGYAKNSGIPINIKAVVSKILPISENDMCVLLSNVMENAIRACQKLQNEGLHGEIEVRAYEKGGKFFLQVINSCDDNITFEGGIPVTDESGHGMGIRSICTIVEKYNGIYSFLVKDGQFIIRVSL